MSTWCLDTLDARVECQLDMQLQMSVARKCRLFGMLDR